MTMADRIMLMNDGRIEQFATPLELYDRPSNTFVGSFVGSPPINLVEGHIVGGSIASFVAGELSVALPMDISHDGPVTLGIRPEDIIVHKNVGDGAYPANVVRSECTGDRTILDVSVAGTRMLIASSVRLDQNGHRQISVDLPRDGVHLFDSDGNRLNIARA
ncbi:hypothetical protein So717_36510 [Roseobacter cerasinus]|uniref:MalK-like OB fold domain-containing protein n=1 Tax=Roseobacter cerasinus TaxID=2602289 RepID=A0A640VU33_9RHOB|nr:TOBE domain-containing protein [Roseobacter cerasinus]GFE51898.1 hypothetical protein So717_36510 [Roseobacter cerasinus]